MDDVKYLETEIAQIKKDYEESGSEQSLDEFAMEWIRLNGLEFALKHNRN